MTSFHVITSDLLQLFAQGKPAGELYKYLRN